MVKSPTVTGTFDAAVAPQIDICQWTGSACLQPALATFTTTTGPGSETVRLDTTSSLYIVNWHTDQFALSVGATYRITASVLGAVLGVADVQVLSNGSAKNVTTGDDIALVDGKTLPIKFRIEQGMVVAIAIAPNPDTVVLAKTSSLTATLTDAHGNLIANQPVNWTTGSSAVASVSAQGVVTGAGLGSTSVTASSNGMTGIGAIVTIRPPVASLVITPATNSIQLGQQVALTATLKDADGNVLIGRTITWSSSDATSASVDANGLVTGIQPQTVTITATSEGVSGNATVTVTPAGFSVKISSLSGGDFHTCGITPDGAGYCWGQNVWGQLGNNAPGGWISRPVAVAGGLQWSQIQAASLSTCGLTLDGTAYCWGSNNVNELGDGFDFSQEVQRASPGQVLTDVRFARMSNFNGSPCALDATGTAWCWGWNDNLRLGVAGGHDVPVVALGGNTWSFLAEGRNNNCGFTTAGAALCFGVIDHQIVGPSPVYTQMTVGDFTVCGLDSGGSVWCSGSNSEGEFGNGTTSGSLTAAAVPSASGMKFASIAAGVRSMCGLTPGGDIYCWGSNESGQLGIGTTTASTAPVQVVSALKFTSLARGYFHYCATATDQGVYCWGANGFGQLGDGTTQDRSVPTRVVTP